MQAELASPCDLRPGSAAKIELMRQRAAAGLALTHPQDATFAEAVLGRERPIAAVELRPIEQPPKLPEPTTPKGNRAMGLVEALETLTASGDEAAKEIDKQIATHETAIAKLKRVRKAVLAMSKTPARAIDPAELERRIIEYLRTNKPAKPGVIGASVGTTAIVIGRAINASKRLAKDSAGRVVLK